MTTAVLREGAEADHGRDVLALGVVPDGAVHLAPRHQDTADVAQVRMAGGAGRALAARRHEAEHHVVARLQRGDARADLLDDTGALVAADHRQGHGHVARDEVLVGVAHAGRRELDEHLTVLGRVELDGLHAPVGVTLPQDGGFGLHGASPGCGARWRALRTLPARARRRLLQRAGSGSRGAPALRSSCVDSREVYSAHTARHTTGTTSGGLTPDKVARHVTGWLP